MHERCAENRTDHSPYADCHTQPNLDLIRKRIRGGTGRPNQNDCGQGRGMSPVTTQAEEHQQRDHHDPTANTHRPTEEPSAQADEDEFPGLAGEGVVHLLSLGVC